MDFKKLKIEYDEHNKSVYLDRGKLIGAQVRFTRDENHNYKKIIQGFNEEAYDYLEGTDRFSGCVRYWSNIPDCYVKTNIFTIHYINERGLCSFDVNNNLCYHSLYPFDIIIGKSNERK